MATAARFRFLTRPLQGALVVVRPLELGARTSVDAMDR